MVAKRLGRQDFVRDLKWPGSTFVRKVLVMSHELEVKKVSKEVR